jgi:hypothetical protein
MIEYTKDQIEKTRGYFEQVGYFLVKENVAGRSLEYFLLPQELNKDLPNFIYRVTNSNLADYILGVSADVPKIIQPYFALAEYIEFKEKGLGVFNRVADTEKAVLEVIPENLKKDYLTLKLDLFKRELELDKVSPESYQLEDEGRNEFSKAVNFLEKELEYYQIS